MFVNELDEVRFQVPLGQEKFFVPRILFAQLAVLLPRAGIDFAHVEKHFPKFQSIKMADDGSEETLHSQNVAAIASHCASVGVARAPQLAGASPGRTSVIAS
jgi:hypothetical protein